MKKLLKRIAHGWRELFRKRRLTLLNATDNSEEWHIHLSPAGIFTGLLAFLLTLFVVILSLVAYTPILEFLPGYRTEADRSRESLIQNIIRLDSMERMMNDMMTYNENISLILSGKTPVARTLPTGDSTRISKLLVVPSHEDSLLRAQMEGEGAYSLKGQEGSSRRRVREAMELTSPIEGIITEGFGISKGSLGVKIAAAASERVVAIEDGTVVMSLWSPERGYTICLQHNGELLSIYRQLSQSLVVAGQTVRAGEMIGYHAEAVQEEIPLFEFELWSKGKPLDPEAYILF